MNSFLYKIVTQAEWQSAQETGLIPVNQMDQTDGYIHLSTKDQYLTTAHLYFSPDDKPLVIELDPTQIDGEICWEWSEQRQSNFPHLYAQTLPLHAAHSVLSLCFSKNGCTIGAQQPIDPHGTR